jgi:phage gp29-like protein
MSDVLDAIFFGFTVGEIVWKKDGKEIIPVDVVGKPQEWFIFNKENELRLRKFKNGQYFFEEGERLPEYKFILTQSKQTYVNPYGERILSKCYWAVQLKRGGVEFWQLMMERYGMPYLIGRYPNTFTEPQKAEFLEQLKQMIEDNITVFEETLGIELKESPQYDIGQLYEKLVDFHNKEISKAVLTVTLTTEIENVGSYKASEIHREMLSYLGVSDKKLVERALNILLEYYVKINYGDEPLPRVKLNKKEAVVEESAERDKILCEIGVKFTKDYFKKRYNLGDGDFEISKQ